MRVTHAMLAATFLQDLQARLERLARSQHQLASGRRLDHASDDPPAFAQSLGLREVLDQLAQWERNGASARSSLEATGAALQQTVDALQRARELAVQGATATLTAEDRQAILRELEQLVRHVVGLANQQVGRTYLFGGTAQSGPPVALAEGAAWSVAVAAPSGVPAREIDTGQTVPVAVEAAELGSALDALVQLRNALAAGSPDDVRATIDDLDTGLDAALARLATVGGRMNRLDAVADRLATARLALERQRAAVEEADLAEVVSRLALEQVVAQASLRVAAQVLPPSLLDFLRP